MQTKSEAESQINLIFSTLRSAETLNFPKVSLLTYGTLILLIPGFEYLLNSTSWGPSVWVHLIFYAILFGGSRALLIYKWGAWKETATHPLLTKALIGQQKFAALSAALSSIALAHAGYEQLIFPVCVYHLASIFYSFGKFSSIILRRMAYLQALLATIAIESLAHSFDFSLFALFTTLLALTFFGGALIK